MHVLSEMVRYVLRLASLFSCVFRCIADIIVVIFNLAGLRFGVTRRRHLTSVPVSSRLGENCPITLGNSVLEVFMNACCDDPRLCSLHSFDVRCNSLCCARIFVTLHPLHYGWSGWWASVIGSEARYNTRHDVPVVIPCRTSVCRVVQ